MAKTEWFLISVETNTDWLLKSNIWLVLFGLNLLERMLNTTKLT